MENKQEPKFLMSRCAVCGHEQKCCAPPCERCQSIKMEMIRN